MNKETYRKLMDKIQFSDDLTQNVMEKIDSLQDQRISLSSLQKRITALTAVLGIAAAAAFGIYNFSLYGSQDCGYVFLIGIIVVENHDFLRLDGYIFYGSIRFC